MCPLAAPSVERPQHLGRRPWPHAPALHPLSRTPLQRRRLFAKPQAPAPLPLVRHPAAKGPRSAQKAAVGRRPIRRVLNVPGECAAATILHCATSSPPHRRSPLPTADSTTTGLPRLDWCFLGPDAWSRGVHELHSMQLPARQSQHGAAPPSPLEVILPPPKERLHEQQHRPPHAITIWPIPSRSYVGKPSSHGREPCVFFLEQGPKVSYLATVNSCVVFFLSITFLIYAMSIHKIKSILLQVACII